MPFVLRRNHRATKSVRNREMMTAFENGTPIRQLMARYGLGEKRVKAILADEKNRRLSSPDPFYRSLRTAGAKA